VIFTIYVAITEIDSDSTTFKKILPFVIVFFAYHAISTNLLSLNRITINEQFITFSAIAKKKIVIKWTDIKRVDSIIEKKVFVIHHLKGEQLQQYRVPLTFKNILDILNFIYLMAPHIETDDFVQSFIYTQDVANDGD
jgi:hypothetical protein